MNCIMLTKTKLQPDKVYNPVLQKSKKRLEWDRKKKLLIIRNSYYTNEFFKLHARTNLGKLF
jgi:hypothetical protein